MRFHHVIATILILIVGAAYTAFLADQIALIDLQHALELSVGEFRP